RWSGRQSVSKTEGSARTEVRTLSSPPPVFAKAMGHAQGCRHALQARRAGSVTPVLHQPSLRRQRRLSAVALAKADCELAATFGRPAFAALRALRPGKQPRCRRLAAEDSGLSNRQSRVQTPPTAPHTTHSSAEQSAGLRSRRPQVRILLGGPPAFATLRR